MSVSQIDEVRRYYDANSAAFERFGQSGSSGAIHRAVWGPGTQTRAQAFAYVDELILQRLRAQSHGTERPLHVVDLGCGTGASLVFLAARAPIVGTGVTISPVQAVRAYRRVQEAGLTASVQCREGDFLALPPDIRSADVSFSIEAFLHVPEPRGYFASCARLLAPGGLLIVCDDFATERATGPLKRRDARWLDEFRRGWCAPTLITPQAATAIAGEFGFTLLENLDLTPYLELARPRDRALAVAVGLARRLPIPGYRWRSLKGGHYLQRALQAGLIDYRFLVWRREPG